METKLALTLSDLWYVTPELILTGFAVLLTLLDLVLPRRASQYVVGWLTLVGLLVLAWAPTYPMLVLGAAMVASVYA